MASRDLAILLRGLVAELKDAEAFRGLVDKQHTKYIVSVSQVLKQLKTQIEAPTKLDPKGRTLTDQQIESLNTAVNIYVNELRAELNSIAAKRGAKGSKDTFDIAISEGPPGTFIVDLIQKGDKNLFRVLQDAHTKPRANLINNVNEVLGFAAVDKSNLIDLGHSGKAVVKIQEEIQIGKFTQNFNLKKEAFKEYVIDSELEILSKFVGDNKTFKLGVDVVVLEPEASSLNRSKATLEKEELKSMRTIFEKWLARGGENGSRWFNQQGSDSALQYARKKILAKAVENKFKTTENIKIDKKSGKAKVATKTKVRVPIKTVRIPLQKLSGINQQEQSKSLLSIKNLLQASLQAEVVPLMTSPRLNYKTGRLANSFRITEVKNTPQGYPSIGFTYMRSPYDIFDPVIGKAPWNSSGLRGPKQLGEQAIRNAARKIALNKFYVRRD